MSGQPVPPRPTPSVQAGGPAERDREAVGGMTVTSFVSPLLRLPGAVPAEGIDEGVALHYGDPLGEQRALAESVGFVDRSNRTISMATGVDRLPWLQSLTTQQVENLPGGCATEALILSPDGRVEHHVYVSNVADSTWLNSEPKVGPSLLGFLTTMRFVLRVEIFDVAAEWAILSVVGPRAVDALGGIGLVAPFEPYEVASLSGGGWLRRMPYPGLDAVDLMVPRILLPQVADRLVKEDVRPAGIEAYEALRVQARRPRLRIDTDPDAVPHEVGWIDVAVARDKQGYRGQEAVTRLLESGDVPRRMVLLRLDPGTERLPEREAVVESDGRQVGSVGTVVRHYQLVPVAQAVVSREVGDDAALTVDGVPATVEPPPEGEDRAVAATRRRCGARQPTGPDQRTGR